MEYQNIELRATWQDDYLKTVCGFANAQGGTLAIGKDPDGKVVGLDRASQLLEALQAKISAALGIVADVNLREEDGASYATIDVAPQPFPISLLGRHYLRSGDKTLSLTGDDLGFFLLSKQGRTWDGLPVPHVKVDDLDLVALRAFRKMARSRSSLPEDRLSVSDEALIDNLYLSEGDYLKRAAILLFHETPEQFVPCAQVKVGYFTTETNLLYHDVFYGPLITMADRVCDTVYTKYFKGIISYDGIQRIETYPIPFSAFREALLNAIVHRDYSVCAQTLIRVYPDKATIVNAGGTRANSTAAEGMSRDSSQLLNPNIANAFFRAGMFEGRGLGIRKIMSACDAAGKPAPTFNITAWSFEVCFSAPVSDE